MAEAADGLGTGNIASAAREYHEFLANCGVSKGNRATQLEDRGFMRMPQAFHRFHFSTTKKLQPLFVKGVFDHVHVEVWVAKSKWVCRFTDPTCS